MISKAARTLTALTLLTTVVLVRPVRAEPSSTQAAVAAAKSRAEAHFHRGIEAYKAGRFKDAIDSFLDAHREYPSPTLSFNAALAYEKLGDSAGALRFYREYLRQNPDAQDKATVQARVSEHEQKLQGRGVQQVTILSKPDSATVIIDDQPVGVTPWTGEIFPGRHALRLRRESYTDASKEFELPAHRAIDVEVELDLATTNAPTAASAAPTPTSPTAASSSATSDVRADEAGLAKVSLPTWVTLGAGVAVLGTAGAFELMRQSAEDDVKNEPVQLDRHEAFDRMESRQTTARILAGVGGAAVIVGGVLLYFDLSKKPESSAWGRVGCTDSGCAAELGGRF
ncbi:MAG: PEGA domain-containing protein [Polyangiaceae bacterium]